MANHDVTNPTYHSDLRKYETTDRGHADVFNANENVLINNDVFLKKEVDKIKQDNSTSNTELTNHKNDTNIHITATERQTWNNKASTNLATTTTNGLMSASDKQAINNLSTTISNSVTGQKVLTEIKKVDGTGSGLDADLLDGKEASAFALSNHTHTNATASQNGFMSAQQAKDLEDIKSATSSSNLTSTINDTVTSTNTINKILTEIKKVDGTGSGLDTDLLDGKEASAFALSNHTHSNATTTANGLMSKEDKRKVDNICTNIKNSEAQGGICTICYFLGEIYGENNATGLNSFSIGFNSEASGAESYAEGYQTLASSTASHAEGRSTEATSYYSHAEGWDTLASGKCSHAGGYFTIANADYSTSIGILNKELSDEDLFVIGKGTTNGGIRSNIFRVSKTSIYGTGTYNTSGADYAELFEWLDQNPSNEDRIGLFVTLDGDKIKIANSNDKYILGIVSALHLY